MTGNRNFPQLEAGQIVGERYQIKQMVGGGSFGDVYEGVDTTIGRRVAVKVLAGDFSRADASQRRLIDRFKREARSAGSLQHPAIVVIHDTGELEPGSRPFMVMEFLEGRDLQSELKKHGPLAPTRILPLFRHALNALGVAHANGIVHKDLKPENLFLIHPDTPRESIKIVDFGVAHAQDDDAGRLTAAGEFFSTANYIAPEYISEQLVTPQMDVYQMGLILVELLMGKPVVHDRMPTRCLMIHAMGQLELPKSLASSPLGPVIVEALAFEHSDRFADGFAFEEALAAIDPATVAPIDLEEERISLRDLESEIEKQKGEAPQATPAALPIASPPSAPSMPSPPEQERAQVSPASLPPAKSNKGLVIALIVVVIIGLGLIGAIGIVLAISLNKAESAELPTHSSVSWQLE